LNDVLALGSAGEILFFRQREKVAELPQFHVTSFISFTDDSDRLQLRRG
jgi:hypothetical protein